MRGIFFVIAFARIAMPSSIYLSASDPEPLGARISLSVLAALAGLVGFLAFATTISLQRCPPSRKSSVLIGACTALTFFLSLSEIHFGGLVPTVAIAIVISVITAVCSPILLRKLKNESRQYPFLLVA